MNSIFIHQPRFVDRQVSLFVDNHPVDGAMQHIPRIMEYFWSRNCSRSLAARLETAQNQDAVNQHPPRRPASLEPLQRRFEVMAYATPCATAVSYNGRQLSYGELDAQADALALHLQQLGLRPGSFCLIDLAPSLAQVRAVLAVLKAGAACLHVDPALPAMAAAPVYAVMQPTFSFTRAAPVAKAQDSGMQTVRCDEQAADLPFGWPDEAPVDRHTPACAYATVSTDGQLCVFIRTHCSLDASLDTAQAAWPASVGQAERPDATSLWQPLSRGALLTIPAQRSPDRAGL